MDYVKKIALGALAAVIAIFGTTGVVTAMNSAATAHPAANSRVIMGAIVKGQTIGIDRKTYRAIVVRPAAARLLSDQAASSSPRSQFCATWSQFGDAPTYRLFVDTHELAQAAGGSVLRDWTRLQWALLAGMPVKVLRARSGAVWALCGH